jgi:ankyrin repeat protein
MDADNWTPLHYACRYSSVTLVKHLLEAEASVDARTDIGSTPMMEACKRGKDGQKIVRFLAENGAKIELEDDEGAQALHYASKHATSKTVKLLLSRGAKCHARAKDGWCPLMFACENALFGAQIIHLLMEAGADIRQRALDGSSALHVAFNTSGEMLKVLHRYLPDGSSDLRGLMPPKMGEEWFNPLSSMTEGLRYGFNVHNHLFGAYDETTPEQNWAFLRNTSFDLARAFGVLKESPDVGLWKMTTTELFYRGLGTNSRMENLLHLALRCRKLDEDARRLVLRHIFQFKLNPYIPNSDGQLPLDLVEDIKSFELLVGYMRWKPDRIVMSWFGNFCKKRLFATLLVFKRLRLGLNHDVKTMLLQYVAQREVVFVPKKLHVLNPGWHTRPDGTGEFVFTPGLNNQAEGNAVPLLGGARPLHGFGNAGGFGFGGGGKNNGGGFGGGGNNNGGGFGGNNNNNGGGFGGGNNNNNAGGFGGGGNNNNGGFGGNDNNPGGFGGGNNNNNGGGNNTGGGFGGGGNNNAGGAFALAPVRPIRPPFPEVAAPTFPPYDPIPRRNNALFQPPPPPPAKLGFDEDAALNPLYYGSPLDRPLPPIALPNGLIIPQIDPKDQVNKFDDNDDAVVEEEQEDSLDTAQAIIQSNAMEADIPLEMLGDDSDLDSK